jgi:hypothetical protein
MTIPFVSETCEGEICWCGKPAVRKVGEEFAYDEPNPERHNLTRYICAYHFAELMGPAGARSVGIAPASVGREEIAAMAWRFRGNERLGGPWYDGAKPSDSPAMHDCFAFADAILVTLRHPVVPVGVSEEQRAKIELILVGYRNRITTLDAATDAIIAALRPTDTGWRDIATANRGQKVIIYDPRWGVTEGLMMDDGTWGLATFNGQIMKASPTHWMPLPPAPTDTGREG